MAYRNYENDEQRGGRFYFSQAQKEKLHKEFRVNENPSKEFRQELAEELQVPEKKVHMWYGARRQKQRIADEKRMRTSPVGKVSINPVTTPPDMRPKYESPSNISDPVTIGGSPNSYPDPSEEYVGNISFVPEPEFKPLAPPPVVRRSDSQPNNSSDFNSNLEKEKANLENLSAREIARHFLNLGKTFDELKSMFDETEAKIKSKHSKEEDPTFTNHSNNLTVQQDDSREKLLEQSEIWIDNDPSVPRGWTTKLGKNGINKGLRKIFRDSSGRIFYSRKQAVHDMVIKNTYTNEEVKLMESYCKSPMDQGKETEIEPTPPTQYNKPSDNRNNFSKSIGEQVLDNNTEWNENDPDLPRGWRSKILNGITMVKGPLPSTDLYLSRIEAYKALLDNPTGHKEELDVFRKYFVSSGTNIEAALSSVESGWNTDLNLPRGWKYTHTIREAPQRKSGYKRLLSFLTHKGSKLNSSLVALEYLEDKGYSSNDKERMKAFINSTKLNEKRKAEQLKTNSSISSFCPTLNPELLSQERLFDDFNPTVSVNQSFELQEPAPQNPATVSQKSESAPQNLGPILHPKGPFSQYPGPVSPYPGAPYPGHMAPYQGPIPQYPGHVAPYPGGSIAPYPGFAPYPGHYPPYPGHLAQYPEPFNSPKVSHQEMVAQQSEPPKVGEIQQTEIKTEPLDSVSENLDIAKLLAEDMIKIEVVETEAEEPNNLENVIGGKTPFGDVNKSISEFSAEQLKSSDQPLLSKQPFEQSLSSERPDEQPISPELPVKLPMSSDLPVEQPMYSEHPNEQPMYSDLPDKQIMPSELPDEQPMSSELPDDQPVSSDLSSELPMSSELPAEQPMSFEQPDERQLSSELSAEPLLPSELPEEQTLPTDFPEEQLQPSMYIEEREKLKSSNLPQEQLLPAVIEDNLPKPLESNRRFNKFESIGVREGRKDVDAKPVKKRPILLSTGNEKSLQFGFYNDESFINKVASETNNTIYKTALFDDTTELNETYEEFNTADLDDSSYMMALEDVEAEVPSHLSEHNYTVPQERAPQTQLLSQEDETNKAQTEGTMPFKEGGDKQEDSFLNKTSLFYEADQIDSSYYDESPVKMPVEESVQEIIQANETEIAQTQQNNFLRQTTSHEISEVHESTQQVSSTPMKQQKSQALEISLQNDDSQDSREFVLSVEFDVKNKETDYVGGINQTEDSQDEGWTNGALDDTKFESDEEELDAIQNMIKNGNDTLDEKQALIDESTKEEEEINDFIQKEFALNEKENAELEEATKHFENELKNANIKQYELKTLVDSTCESADLLEEDVDNFLINDLLKSDEDDLDKQLAEEYDSEKTSVKGDERYEPDPFLPDGWRKATYFVKKTGIEIHRYKSHDGQKFTSRKLMISYMKNKGYNQNDLDRVQEGGKVNKRKAKSFSSAEETLEEPVPEEPKVKKIIRERFITSLSNEEREDNKRKRPADSEEKRDDTTESANSSNNYNADISSNVDSFWSDGAEKKRRKGRPRKEDEEGIRIKKEPNTDSILEPVNIKDTTSQKDEDESSIGPKMSVSRNEFKQLALLFLKSPIPSNSELASISKSTDVSAKDVKWWFIKIRHKVKMNKVEKEQVKNYLDSIRICHYSNGVITL